MNYNEFVIRIGDGTFVAGVLIMDKGRQMFIVESGDGEVLAKGVLYDDGNIQILWRKSIGWTGEQHYSIERALWCEVGATCIRLVDEFPEN